MADMKATLLVSPYLLDVSSTPEAGRFLRSHGLAARVLFDFVSYRATVLTSCEAAALEGALEAGRTDGGALSALLPDAGRRLIDRGVLLPEADAYRKHRYTTIELEIVRQCNFRCSFCPVKEAPKPRGFMSDEVYELIMDRVREYGAPTVSLNNYSEPSLDPTLVRRVSLAGERGLKVKLFSNASLLDREKIAALARLGNVLCVVVNLPSVDPEEYARVTGTNVKTFDRVVANLRLLHDAGLVVRLSVNTPRDGGEATVAAVNERFERLFGRTPHELTNDRAGALDAVEYATPVRHVGPLNGCALSFHELSVSWEGKAILCCQDYDQQHVLGDLRTETIAEIAEGAKAVELRRWIFGGATPPADLICNGCVWTTARRPFGFGGIDEERWRAQLARELWADQPGSASS